MKRRGRKGVPSFSFLLEEMELTQRSLAKELGCSRSLVFYWAHGQKPSERYLPQVCDILGIESEFLWP